MLGGLGYLVLAPEVVIPHPEPPVGLLDRIRAPPALPHQGSLSVVRRVGFGGGESEPSRSRRPRPARRATDADQAAGGGAGTAATSRSREAQLGEMAATFKERRDGHEGSGIGWIIAIVFLSLWLVGWTVGIFAAVAVFSQDFGGLGDGDAFGQVFLAVWIIIAGVGWWFAARTLLRLLRRKPLHAGRNVVRSRSDATRPPSTRSARYGRDPGDRGGGADGGMDGGGDGD